MAKFVIITQRDDFSTRFFVETRERLKASNYMKNPFTGGITSLALDSSQDVHIVRINPIFFNFSIFGWISALGILYIFGPVWMIYPPLFIGLLGFFWSKWFFIFVIKKGLKKAGYKGAVEVV